MKVKEKRAIRLIPLIIIIVIAFLFTYINRKTVKHSYYNEQILAYEKMVELSNAVKNYKYERNIPIYDYDYFQTGLLGEEYNEYTTSLGHLESKRTSTNPDMAALVLKMFKDVGLERGDNVAVGLSGSFPALNIAVISAGEVLGLNLNIISSFGSSTYGTNHRDLTFPEILDLLNKDGLTKYYSGMVSLGGDNDTAEEKPEEIINPIIDRYKNLGFNLQIEEDYLENIKEKIQFYEEDEIDCYVAVGGNLTFLGLSEADLANRQGILDSGNLRSTSFSEENGLIQYFLSKNIPTIHLLNVRKIVTDYGLPFDPTNWIEKGQSNIYFETEYNKIVPLITIIGSFLYLIYSNKERFSIYGNNSQKKI